MLNCQPPADAELSAAAQELIAQDCAAFFLLFHRALVEAIDRTTGYTWQKAGHDFWLTRNGHGVGFWDRDLPGFCGYDTGDALTKACHMTGPLSAYLNDGGLIDLD